MSKTFNRSFDLLMILCVCVFLSQTILWVYNIIRNKTNDPKIIEISD